ncbi:MAG: exonuclease domain-containing protein [Cyclobacteriaceae bacterium]
MYAIVDIETTGGDGHGHKVTEFAVYVSDGKKEIDHFTSLVNPGKLIPTFITQMTGITNEMVIDAPPFYEIANQVVQYTQDCTFVAHNVSFDYSILKKEFKSLGYNYQRPRLCTVNLGRRLVKNLPSYSLGSLCKHFNIDIKHRHRAFGDAKATLKLFNYLLAIKERDEIEIKKNLPSKLTGEEIDALPEATGVYYLLNGHNEVLYVGKSVNIRSRVLDHFRNHQSIKAIEMASQIASINYQLTGSELIALLLESQEIKALQPRFNRAQRRRTLPWGLYQKVEQGYLKLFLKKSTDNEPIMQFRSKESGKSFLHKVSKENRLCQSFCGLYRNVGKACMLHQLNLCNGACNGKEEASTYNQRVMDALDIYHEDESYLIIDEGKGEYQKSIVLVENGIYKGFGYVDEYVLNWGLEAIKEHLAYHENHKDIDTIIRGFIKRKKVEQVVKLSNGFLAKV